MSTVVHADEAPAAVITGGVCERQLAAPIDGSPLALALLEFESEVATEVRAGPGADLLLYVIEGDGEAAVGEERCSLAAGTSVLLRDGEGARVCAGAGGLALARATVDGAADVHAPMGAAARSRQLDLDVADDATSNRSFQVLLGPDNGSSRATLFVGVVPPGAAPWHFHQYDEIILILRGEGRYHRVGAPPQPSRPGSALRIRPREIHINENASNDDMHVLGVFTPAGSPSAAFLPPADGLPPHPG